VSLLDIRNLSVSFPVKGGYRYAVEKLDLSLEAGGTLGIVGESGSGKSTVARAIMQLITHPRARIEADRLHFMGEDLLALPERRMRLIRGARVAMVFQEPMVSLDPLMRIGTQITEALQAHRDMSGGEARDEAIRLLARVGIPDPHRRLDEYPHNFSGGMRQRVMIAIAISSGPALLLADEPTTALDVTVQAQIINLLADLNRENGMAVIMITHNLGIVPWLCERTMVMYAGRTVEIGDTRTVLKHPSHPYTKALLRSIPRLDAAMDEELEAIPGRPPRLGEIGAGCPFAPRCPEAEPVCREGEMPLQVVGEGRMAACIHAQPKMLLKESA
jgi:oligopeptide/dipeptide ABC transporter ATP-binding protein